MNAEVVHITTGEVAKMARVDTSTVRRWVERGTLVPSMKLPGGQYRFVESDVVALLTPTAPSSDSSPESDDGAFVVPATKAG